MLNFIRIVIIFMLFKFFYIKQNFFINLIIAKKLWY